MKKLLFILIAFVLIGCNRTEIPKVDENDHFKECNIADTVCIIKTDTVYKPIPDSMTLISKQVFEGINKKIITLEDSIIKLNTTIPYEHYINAMRIEKIKYYIKITENRPTNKKYFFGWIRRTMSEN